MIGDYNIVVNDDNDNKETTTLKSSMFIVKNVITFKKMLREHLMMPLTCESINTNLTVPVTKTILIDLNCKFFFFLLFEFKT